MQKITEDNQIPVHLHVSASLQYVAGLKGNALVEFFHGNIAEVLCLTQGYEKMPCDLSVLDSILKRTFLIKLKNKTYALQNLEAFWSKTWFLATATGILPGIICLQNPWCRTGIYVSVCLEDGYSSNVSLIFFKVAKGKEITGVK